MYKSYKDLKVWQISHEFVKEIYKTDFNLPNDEKFGLNSQIKRASMAIPANIAEGSGRYNPKEFRYFLSISKGSVNEVNYYLLFCYEMGYLAKEDYNHLNDRCDHINRMLGSLISKIKI